MKQKKLVNTYLSDGKQFSLIIFHSVHCQNFYHSFKLSWKFILLFPLSFLLVQLGHGASTSTSSHVKVFSSAKNIGHKNPAEDPFKEMTPPKEAPSLQSWLGSFFATDEEGILESMQKKLHAWQEEERMEKDWNLESTGLYSHTAEEKKENAKFIQKNFLKYIDKRLAKEAKKSPVKGAEDSVFKRVSRTHQALKPSTQVNLGKNINLKLKAQLFQGKATILINNPFFHWSTEFDVRGGVNIVMMKNVEEIGLQTGLNYKGREKIVEATVNKQLTRTISSTVSSTQDAKNLALTKERKVELRFIQFF